MRKSVPQRLKPSMEGFFTARLNPCPSCRDAFPSACLAFKSRPTEKANLDKSG
jgi:hypothetical protein